MKEESKALQQKEKEIEVCVSITLSKTVRIKVSDYKVVSSGKDEDGDYFEDVDYSDCDLKGAVEEQIQLPQYGWVYLDDLMNYPFLNKNNYDNIINNLKNWNVDEMEVIKE